MIWGVDDDDCAIFSSPHSSSGAFGLMRSEQALGVLDGQVVNWNTIAVVPSNFYLLISQRVWLALCSCHIDGYGSLCILLAVQRLYSLVSVVVVGSMYGLHLAA